MNDDKIKEARLRRLAARQGLQVQRSRSRTEEAAEFGTYMVVNTWTNTVDCLGLSSGYGLSLDDIEAFLSQRQAVAA